MKLGLVPKGAGDNVYAIENQYFGCGLLYSFVCSGLKV